MGHIKEPKGVDFIIKSKPLTNKERVAISEFIREYKANYSGKKAIKRTRVSSLRKQQYLAKKDEPPKLILKLFKLIGTNINTFTIRRTIKKF